MNENGKEPDNQWEQVNASPIGLDFDGAIKKLERAHGAKSFEGEFYKSTVNRLMAMLHHWRMNSMRLLVPGDCHEELRRWMSKNMQSSRPIPVPFESWGLDVEQVNEVVMEQKTAEIVVSMSGEGSAGLKRKHELLYGERTVSMLEYEMLPQSKDASATVSDAVPMWMPPAKLPPVLHAYLSPLYGDPLALRYVGEGALVSLAHCHRGPLLAGWKESKGAQLPPSACKLKFLGAHKDGNSLVEVAPAQHPNVAVWALGELPR